MAFLDLNGDALNRVSRRALSVLQEELRYAMEARGEAGVTSEIRDVLEKVVSLFCG